MFSSHNYWSQMSEQEALSSLGGASRMIESVLMPMSQAVEWNTITNNNSPRTCALKLPECLTMMQTPKTMIGDN